LELCILNQLVPVDELLQRAMRLAQDIAEQDPVLIRHIRRGWDATETLPHAEAMAVRTEHALESGSGQRRAEDIAARREQVVQRAKEQRRT
jgi:enoyl-CoA hydratase/carnithine racemase